MSKPSKRIFISRTEKEWNKIEERLKELGRSDFNSYVRGQLFLLEKMYKESPSKVCSMLGKKIQKPHIVQPSPYKTLLKISVNTSTPVSTIVDRLIIDPLLLSK